MESDCPRCQRLGLACERDTTYRRINKKRCVHWFLKVLHADSVFLSKIDELERHVQHLSNVLYKNPSSPHVVRPPYTDFTESNLPQISPAQKYTRPLPETEAISTVDAAANLLAFGNSVSRIQPSPQPLGRPILDQFLVPQTPRQVPFKLSATKVRAIESSALGQEEIDSMFQK